MVGVELPGKYGGSPKNKFDHMSYQQRTLSLAGMGLQTRMEWNSGPGWYVCLLYLILLYFFL